MNQPEIKIDVTANLNEKDGEGGLSSTYLTPF